MGDEFPPPNGLQVIFPPKGYTLMSELCGIGISQSVLIRDKAKRDDLRVSASMCSPSEGTLMNNFYCLLFV